jgi:teichuronic acid exporter
MTESKELSEPQAVPPEPAAEHAGLRKRAVRGGLMIMGSRLAIQLFAWGVTLQVARLLRPYDYGLMTTGVVFIGLPDLLAEAGVAKALVQNKEISADDQAQCFTVSLLLALALYLGLFFLAGPAADHFETPELTVFLRTLGVAILLTPFRSVPQALLDRELHMGRQSLIALACGLIQASLVLGLALAGAGYWALAAGVLGSRAAEVLGLIGCTGWRPRLAWPSQRAGRMLAFGLHVTAANLFWFIYSNSDFAAVGAISGAVALGYYSLAFQLVSLPVQKLTSNVNQVAYPLFCRLQNDPAKLRAWYLRLTTLLSFFGMPMLAGMVLVAEEAFAVVLGERWLPAVPYFRLLSVAGMVMIVASTITHLFNALGRADLSMKYAAACASVLPLVFFTLANWYGVLGVCWGWLAYPVIVAVAYHLTRHVTGVGVTCLIRAQAPVVAAVVFMSVAVLLAGRGLPETWPTAARLIALISVGMIAYSAFVLLLARRTVVADVFALLREMKG